MTLTAPMNTIYASMNSEREGKMKQINFLRITIASNRTEYAFKNELPTSAMRN